jgi:O-antigen/teichoic acid export membrane protein
MINRNVQFFSREQLKSDLKRRSVYSTLNKAITSGASIILTLASGIILARLLAPEIFGVFAMVFSVTEIARYIMEVGLGTATVQKEEITQEEVSVLFWINFSIGTILMVAVACISPAVAWFYHDAKLINICLMLSLTFLFRGSVVQHRALLERQMMFGYLGIVNLISNLISFSTAIVLAYYGFGVWSLVCREMVYVIIYNIGVWSFCNWIPSFPKRNTGVRTSLLFGAHLSGVSFMQYLTQNMDKVLIGRFCGASSLGLYSKALQLALMPVENIRMIFWDVGLSPLSALQGDSKRYKQFYGRLLSIQSLIYMPIVIFFAIQAEEVIRLLLGEIWVSAAPLLTIFAIAGLVTPIIATFQLAMISHGKTHRYLVWGVINGICMITAYIFGINWGVIGVAYAYMIACFLLFLGALNYCLKDTSINILFVISNISIAFLSSLGSGVVLIKLSPYLPKSSLIINLTSSLLFFLLTYFGIILCIPKGRKHLTELLSYRSLLSRNKL